MDTAFVILWISIISVFLLRIYLLSKINVILKRNNIDFNFYSTIIIMGNIPKLPLQSSKVELFKKIYNNLTIVFYVFAFVNFILLAFEKVD